jgi:hypothetical protein
MTGFSTAEPSAPNTGLIEMPPTDGEISPFAFTGPSLIANGYSALPIIPGDKVPGTFTGGEWHMMRAWERFCKTVPLPNLVSGWSRMPGAGVGVACGRGLVLVDIDLDEAVGPVMAALPPSIVGKKGAKGLTLARLQDRRGRRRRPPGRREAVGPAALDPPEDRTPIRVDERSHVARYAARRPD